MKTLLSGILVLLILAPALAEDDPKVSVSLEAITVEDAAATIAALVGVEISVSEQMKEREVSLKLQDVPLSGALAKLAKAGRPDGEAVKREDGTWRIRRRWEDFTREEKIEKTLAETKVNVNFADTSLKDAFNFLGQYGGVSIAVDPELAKEKSPDELLVNLQADGVTLKNALDLITLTKGLAWDLRWGAVFVGTPGRLESLPKDPLGPPAEDAEKWELDLREKLAEGVSFSFDSATLDQALEFLRTMKQVNVVFDPDAKSAAASANLTLSVNDVTLEHALSLMLLPRGFAFELADGVVLITKK